MTCSLDHLWVVADRILWSNSISSDLMYDEYESGSSPRHRWHVILASLFSFYVEDRWSIEPELSTRGDWYDSAGWSNWDRWSWNLRVSVNYRFGARLF